MKTLKLFLIAALGLCLWGCDDYTMSADDEKKSAGTQEPVKPIENAGQLAGLINNNIQELHRFMALQDKGGLVVSITPFTNESGEGYEVIFTTEDTVALYGKLPSGVTLAAVTKAEGSAPEFNIALNESDDQYYWTLNGQFLKNVQGNNIPVSDPYIVVRANGDEWEYSIDNGSVWIGAGKISSLELPYSLASESRGKLTFGSLTFVPEYKPSLGYSVKSDFELSAGEKYKLNYRIDYYESENPEVSAVSADGWDIKCTLNEAKDGGQVMLTAPMTAKVGQKSSITMTFVDGGNTYTKDIEVLVSKPSAYAFILQLGDEYSMFKEMVRAYDVTNEEGDVTNSYLDMYNADGAPIWSMRSKDGKTTLLVPSNTVIEAAIEEADELIRKVFKREPTELDHIRFKQWILRSCFFAEEMTVANLKGTTDLNCISGFNKESGIEVEAALWRPSVQKILTDNKEEIYNGMVFYLEYLHIPAYVVIHRVKSIVSDVYTASGHPRNNKVEKPFTDEYFSLENAVLYQRTNNNDGKKAYRHGALTMSDGYVVPEFTGYMCAINQDQTYDGPATFEMAGVMLDGDKVVKVELPAGEYILSIGTSGRSNGQTFDLYFKWENDADYTLVKAGNKVDASYDISGGGYADYYTVYYQELMGMSYPGSKYIGNLDRDGTEVGSVVLSGDPQAFWLKQSAEKLGSGSDKDAMSLFHWTLRPTSKVY